MQAVLQARKTPIKANVRSKRVTFNRFGLLNDVNNTARTLVANYAFNCDCSDGRMRTGVTFQWCPTKTGGYYSFVNMPATPRGVFYMWRTTANGEELNAAGFYTDDGDLYILRAKTQTFSKLSNIGKNSKAVWVLDEDRREMLAFVGEDGVRVYYIEGSETCFSKALLPVGCFAQGRLFSATKGGKLVYLKPYRPRQFAENIDDCGEVQLPTWAGEVVSLVTDETYVYAFCNNGIFRLQVAASARDFVIETIPYPYETILGESVCATAGKQAKIFFLTTGGLYCLQKTAIRKIALPDELVPDPEKTTCKGVCFDGKYYVRFITFQNKEKAVVVDVEKESSYETAPTMYEMNMREGAICVQENALHFMHTHEVQYSAYRTIFKARTDFGICKEKRLKKLYVEGSGVLRLTVESSGHRVHKDFNMSGGRGEIEVDLPGKEFVLTIKLLDGTVVRQMHADIEYAK